MYMRYEYINKMITLIVVLHAYLRIYIHMDIHHRYCHTRRRHRVQPDHITHKYIHTYMFTEVCTLRTYVPLHNVHIPYQSSEVQNHRSTHIVQILHV
jgi:hypothetical protein